MLYPLLQRLFPAAAAKPRAPRRIVLIRPCCIGDVVMATAALSALRAAFPKAEIHWAVGPWSARAIKDHPALDAILDTGADMPNSSPRAFWAFLRRLRAGQYDLAVSLVRSPLMSLALALSGIPLRAGLDSGGRGFGYNVRVAIDPAARQHESAIYLKVISALTGQPAQAYANLPVSAAARAAVQRRRRTVQIVPPYILAHPGGGSNPGAQMDSKRYPPAQLADLLERVAAATGATVILIGGPSDVALVDAVDERLAQPAPRWVGALSFAEIGALAADALLYIGNDSGLTHLAAASGGRTVMIMGPTDPQRYAPYTATHLALWKAPQPGAAASWDWQRDGITVEAAVAQILEFLAKA